MQKQIIYDRWVIVETSDGTQALLQELVGKTTEPTIADVRDYITGEFISAHIMDGYGARLSLPGYLDCTDWTVFATEEEAQRHLIEMYDE